jgi:hypothetical protein
MDGPFGSSSESPVHVFVLPVIPTVQILRVDLEFESVLIRSAYPAVTGLDFFEAQFLHLRQLAIPSADGGIIFFFDIMNSTIPRNIPLKVSVRAVFRSPSFLASEYTSLNITLPLLPVPNVTAVVQKASSFVVVVESLPQNLPSASGFNFSFGSGESGNVVLEVFRNVDTQFVFDQAVLNFLRDINQTSFVSVRTIFRQRSLISGISAPLKFMLLLPPVSPSLFIYQLHTGQQNCVNLSWVSPANDIALFKILIFPISTPIYVDGRQRQTSVCNVLVENNIYGASITSITNSGESPAAQLEIRFFMKPQLIFSSVSVSSIGLLPNEPSFRAIIYNFPPGLNSSTPGFGIIISRSQAPSISTNAMIVSVDAALHPADPTVVAFRTPQLPDLCPSGMCLSYEVNLCFFAPSSLSACTVLLIRSVSTAIISKVSKVSGPTRPIPFIDDIFVFIARIDPVLIDGISAVNSVVDCFGASGHFFQTIQFNPNEGTATVRIVPPAVNTATRMIFAISLQNSRTLNFVPRINVTFSYDAFDTPTLTGVFPEQATINTQTVIDFYVASANVRQANVSFASKRAAVFSISNTPETGSTVRAIMPEFSLHEASSCQPPAPHCSSFINATLSLSLTDLSIVTFSRLFQLLLPVPPRVQPLSSLIVDINNPTTLQFSISDSRNLEKVLIGNTSCIFSLFSATGISVQIPRNLFSIYSQDSVIFQSRVDPEYFSVTASFRVSFRDFSQPSVEAICPSFGPLIGGTAVAIFTKEMSSPMFDSCIFFNTPCVVLERFSNMSISKDMPVTKSEYWSSLASATMNSLIDSNPSDVSTLGVAIVRVPVPSLSFTGGLVNLSFAFTTKVASKSFYYVPDPSTPAVVSHISPSEVSELGGRTVEIYITNLQIVASKSNMECLIGISNVIAEVLDIKYSGTNAIVVILVPPLLPGVLEGIVGPKANTLNRGLFKLSVMSSIPFALDPFSTSPTIVYQDHVGNISVLMTGIPPQTLSSSFSLLVNSFSVPRSQIHVIVGQSRSAQSRLLFSIVGFTLDSSVSDTICTLQFNGNVQSFNMTVLPAVPLASLSYVAPTFGSSLGGSAISLSANLFREIVPPALPRFFVNNIESVSQFTNIKVDSDKFSSYISFVVPQLAEGVHEITVAHPIVLQSNITFLFHSIFPVRKAETLIGSVRRGLNTTLQVAVENFVNLSHLDIFTTFSSEYSISQASVLRALSVGPSSAMLTVLLPSALPRSSRSQVLWIIRDGVGNASFSFALEPSDAPFLASYEPASVNAYGGSTLTFIVTSFLFPVSLQDWTCSFPSSNVSLISVTRIDASTVRLQCVAPLNLQAIFLSQSVVGILIFNQESNKYSLPFQLTFAAPPSPSLALANDNPQILASSASVFVRNFAPFNSIQDLRLFIENFRVAIHNYIIRNGVLQLQFAVSCSECNCCSGQTRTLTVSNTMFPMMAVSISVTVEDPNAPAVVLMDPSVIPASGGSIVEIQVNNFPSRASVVAVSFGSTAAAVAFQVVSAAGSTVSSIRFFAPALSSGYVGYTIRVDDSDLLSVASTSSNAIMVSNLVISGHCSAGSIPAFGGTLLNCVITNLPIPAVQGLLEFRYTLSDTTVLVASKHAKFVSLSDQTLSVDLALPNIADRIFETVSIRLQILNTDFRSLIFSTPIDIVPSLPQISFVEPSSAPNSKPVNVVVYVEYFSGSLMTVEAMLDGFSIQDNFRAESLSSSVTAFFFILPKAMSAGPHFVSFWSGEKNKALSFSFFAIDVLHPQLIRLHPTQVSTSGGDVVAVSVMNFDFDSSSSIMLGSTAFTSVSAYCENDPQICVINAISPPSSAGVFNISLVTSGLTFILPERLAAEPPVPTLDLCVPTVGIITGGTNVTCYFLNIPASNTLAITNFSSRFDSTTAPVTAVMNSGSVLGVKLTAPIAAFEGNTTLRIDIGTSTFSFFPFTFVRPCNFETFCSSRGFIPFDLKILQEPLQDETCSENYCLDPKTLPNPSINLVSPSVVSTIGGTLVTMFCSNLLALTATDVSVSLASTISPVPVPATVTSYDFSSSIVVFSAPSLSFEGLFSAIVSTRRSRQFVSGIKEISSNLMYETPIVGKAAITSIFPISVPHNTVSVLFAQLQNFVPVASSAQISLSINNALLPNNCQVLFSSRAFTLVQITIPAFQGPSVLNVSIWNAIVAQSRSAEFELNVQPPPVPAVFSVFPDGVEAASDTVVSLGLENVQSPASGLYVRTNNGVFVANLTVVSSSGEFVFVTFSLPSSKIPGQPFLFDTTNNLQVASIFATSMSAEFHIFVLAPSKPQIIIPPRFSTLLTTEAPLATFVLLNFGGMPGTDSISATLSMNASMQSLAVVSYQSDGIFATVSVQFPTNIVAVGSAELVIFPKAVGSEGGAVFALSYKFPEPIVSPSFACTNGKSSGFIILHAVFPDNIEMQNFQVFVGSANAQIVFVNILTRSSVNISIVFPPSLASGVRPVDIIFSHSGSSTTLRSSVEYFLPPTIVSVNVTEISTLNRALVPVKVTLKDFPSVGSMLFSVTTRSYSVLIDSNEQSTYDTSDTSVITFFAPVGPPSGRLRFEVACTNSARFPPAVLEFLVAQFDILYQAPLPSITSVIPSSVDMSGGSRITVTAQYLSVATGNQVILYIGSRIVRNVSVLYSDREATSFTAIVTPSSAPGLVQGSVLHTEDSRPAAFTIRYTGRQTAFCTRNCVALASRGSINPVMVSLRFFSLVTRSNQLRCSVSPFSTCSLELVNVSSTVTFVEITIGPASSSAQFQNGILYAAVTVSTSEDSATFIYMFVKSPTILSANFMTESSFRLVFDQNIMLQSGLDSPCNAFENSISLLGQGARCQVSRNLMVVYVGFASSLLPGSTVKILPGLIFGTAQVSNSIATLSDSASGDVAVLPPSRSQIPNVQYLSPSSVGPCDDLDLRIETPSPRARYSWICLNDDSVTAAARARFVGTRFVKLRSTDLPRVNFGYKFVLSVTSFFGRTANSSVFDVFKLSQAVPNIINSKQSSLITVPIIVNAQVEFSSCPVKAADIVFEWRSAAGDVELNQILRSFTSSSIIIPEYTLTAGKMYEIMCSVYKSDEPSKKSVGTYTIETLFSPLQASVVGGGRVASVESEVVIDASASYDPDVKSPGTDALLQIIWQCTMMQGELRSACRDANGAMLNLTSGRILRFPPDFLMAGTTYEFSVNIFKTGRSAGAVAVVQMATGLFVEDATLVLASNSRVNADDKVSVVCKSSIVISSYEWQVKEVGSAAALAIVNSDPTGRSLLLSPRTLSPGKDYEVSAIVTAKNRQPTKLSMPLTVNSPPASGTCSVTPGEGIASVTAFSIVCDGWVDNDGGISYEVLIPDDFGKMSRYTLDMTRPMYLSPIGGNSILNVSVVISDKFSCETRRVLSVKLSLPPPLPANEVGDSCKMLSQLGKHVDYAQCIDSSFAVQSVAASTNSTGARALLSSSNQGSSNATLLKAAVLQKVFSAADQAPLAIEALSRTYLQTITPLCSGGDLGTQPSSLSTCVSLLSRTSQTLLVKPVAAEACDNVISTASGILASFANNRTQESNSSGSMNSVDTTYQIQEILNITSNAIVNSAKQAYLGDQPLTFTTPFSKHVASRATIDSLNGTIAPPNMARISFAPNLASYILGAESRGQTEPISIIAESYNSSVRWASVNRTFVSGVHGLSFFRDSGAIEVKNLPSNCTINISIPLDQNAQPLASLSSYRCNYWDAASLSWKQDGCRVIAASQTHVTVSTTHLTQFGIEYDPPAPMTSTAIPSSTASPLSTSTAIPSSTASPLSTSAQTTPQNLPVPLVGLNPQFARLQAVLVTVSVSLSNFDASSVCSIIFTDLSSILVSTTYQSPASVRCLVPGSTHGRVVNVSVSGIVNVSAEFTQFESYTFTAVQWHSSLDSFSVISNSSLPSIPDFPCNRVFAASSVTLFGTSYSCSMFNHSIKVFVGSGTSLRMQQLILEPTERFYKLNVPTEIFATTLPAMTFVQPVPVPSAVVGGPTFFGKCSTVSLKVTVTTAAQVVRAPELMPTFNWSLVSVHLHTNATSSNASYVSAAVNLRLSSIKTSQVIFLSNSWAVNNFLGGNLPAGEYKVQYRVLTWYGGLASDNISFTIAIADAPVLYPIQVPSAIYRNRISQFSAAVEFSSCSDGLSPSFSWRVQNWARQLVHFGSQKTLTVPPATLQLSGNNTFFVELVVNGVHRVSSTFVLTQLQPVAVISNGTVMAIGRSGGSVSAAASYDPNYGLKEQPPLFFMWTCTSLDMTNLQTSKNVLNLPQIPMPINCTVTVTTQSSAASHSATVTVIPVSGSPPSLAIASSLTRFSPNQNLALSVKASPGVDSQYTFQWSASKFPSTAEILTSLSSSTLALRAVFFANINHAITFHCRVTHKVTGDSSETSMTIGVNEPPACADAALSVSSEECVGSIGSVCPVTAMKTKLRVALTDASNSVILCGDEDGPVKYLLVAFTASCSMTAKGRVISSASSPSFYSIQLANGVKSLAIDSVDSLGASRRMCSQDLTVSSVTEAALSGLFQAASLVVMSGDVEAQKRFVSNIAGSLVALYNTSNSNTAALDSVKLQALEFLYNSSGTPVTDSADAMLAASSLHALVRLPGSLSNDQTASAISMFSQFAVSSIDLIVSGVATNDFPMEVGPVLVEGSLDVAGKLVSRSRSRRILTYQNGMSSAYSALISAAKVQVLALAASQDAVVTEQAPSLVLGVRRLRSASAMSPVVPSSAILGVSVSVSPDADASSAVDVGLAVVVQASSPFTDSGSVVLISPVVSLQTFDAATGTAKQSVRNVIEAVFPVSQSSHDLRTVTNEKGQRKSEVCVVYDGTAWSTSCSMRAYSSATQSITCTCNATASTLAVSAAEIIVDCGGKMGGPLVLDACKTCGGSATDAANCSPEDATVLNLAAIIGGASGGFIVLAVSAFLYFRRQRRGAETSTTQFRQNPPQNTILPPPTTVPPSESAIKARPFARKSLASPPSPDAAQQLATEFSEQQGAAASSINRNDSPERILPGSPLKTPSLSNSRSSTQTPALNQSATVERGPTQLGRYQELLARQRELLGRQAGGILAADSSFEQYDSPPARPERPSYDSGVAATVAADSEGVHAERYRRLLMTRQRLSMSSTIIPPSSPALNLPSATGQYANVVAKRLERLQSAASNKLDSAGGSN